MQDLIKKINEEMNEATYVASVEVSLDLGPDYIDELYYPKTIDIPFEVNYENRSWGAIKDVSIHFTKNLQFEYERADGSTGNIDIDLNSAEVTLDWTKGNVYAPTAIDITLDKEGKVQDADLECSYSYPSQ